MPKVGSRPQTVLPSGNLLEILYDDLDHLGIVKERSLAAGLYLVGTSRLLENPLSGIVRGHSCGGKSAILRGISSLFPPEQVSNKTARSARSLAHLHDKEADLSHKLLILGERPHVKDDKAWAETALWRQLVTEGELYIEVAQGDGKGGHATVTKRVQGPVASLETTTLELRNIFKEDQTRLLVFTVDTSPELNRAVVDDLGLRSAGKKESTAKEVIRLRHQEWQRTLVGRPVVIPYAERLVAGLPTYRVESRRAAQRVISAIEACATLHQQNREVDGKGRLVADLDDYRAVRHVLTDALRNSLSVTEGANKFWKASHARSGNSYTFTVSQAEAWTDGKPESIKKWLQELLQCGSAVIVQKHAGPVPAQWCVTKRDPNEVVLPDLG